MSLILDALKKAEQDRQAGQAPVLDEMLVRRGPASARRRRDPQQHVVAVAAIAAALLFAGAGVVYWLWPTPPPATAAVAVAPAAAPAPSSTGEPAAPALRIDPERLEAPVADVPDDAVDTRETGAAEATTLDDLDGEAAPRARDKSPSSGRPTPVTPAPQAATAPQAAIPTTAEPTTPVSEPATPPPRAVAEPAARPLKEMPSAFRSEFPPLSVDVHVYDENPLRRFVLVNGKKYRETDTLVEGPRVVEITPNGVIVEQRGSKVLLELPR